MDDNLKKYRSKSQQLKAEKKRYFVIKASLICILTGNFIFMLNDTIQGNYRDKKMLAYFWCLFILVFCLMVFSHWAEKPHIMRILHVIMIIRNIMPMYNFEDRQSFDDISFAFIFCVQQNITL